MTESARSLSAAALVREAERLCGRRDLRLTDLRRRVLKIVGGSRRPLTAYAILRKLGETAPPTAYRTLAFLVEHGFLHKIQTLGAYFACSHPRRAHACYFLLCADCGRCEECCTRRIAAAVASAAAGSGFAPRAAAVEITGVCRRCRAKT
ncbi:MAG: Fur family transcriptional regulator [Gammaproteobacteria bacterium]